MPEYRRKPPKNKSVRAVTASRNIQGSPWGGGGFVDYGGLAAQTFQDHQNFLAERDEYSKAVKDAEVKELDADFGKLTYEPSGVGGFDASATNMAREWKADYVQAKRDYDKGLLSPAEFSERKNNLFGNAEQFKKASEALTQTVKDYTAAVENGTISDSTPPEIREALDQMRKGGQGMSVENIDGVPTLVGIAGISGNQIRVPISSIASGENTWRFNEKFDSAGALETISEKFSGKNLSPDQVSARAGHEIDKIIGNQSTLRAVAADELGISALEYEEMEDENPDLAKMLVKNHLIQKLNNEYIPKQIGLVDQARLDQGQQRIDLSANRAITPGADSATQLKINQAQIESQQNLELLNQAYKTGNFRGLIGRAGITGIDNHFFGDGFTVEVGDNEYDIDPNNPADQQLLSNLLKAGNLQQGGNDNDPLGIN